MGVSLCVVSYGILSIVQRIHSNQCVFSCCDVDSDKIILCGKKRQLRALHHSWLAGWLAPFTCFCQERDS